MDFKEIYLLSESEIKRKAVEEVFDCKVQCLEPGDTKCPQPIGVDSAFQCVELRMKPHLDLIRSKGADTLFVVVENYVLVEQYSAATDRVALMLVSNGGYSKAFLPFGAVHIDVPRQYDTILSFAEFQNDGNQKGLQQTIGQSLSDLSDGRCPPNDWFRYVDPRNPTRFVQIIEAFGWILPHLKRTRQIIDNMQTYRDFPKDGVVFRDMFAVMADPDLFHHLNDRLENTCRSFVNDNKSEYFVVGIESRGLLLGSMLAALLRVPFVPLRKKNKLPRDAERPIAAISYETEYSSDVIELQPEHLQKVADRKCILIDDIIATGGSMCAAIELLKRANVTVTNIIVLCDIEPLRAQWRAALDRCAPKAKVSFVL